MVYIIIFPFPFPGSSSPLVGGVNILLTIITFSIQVCIRSGTGIYHFCDQYLISICKNGIMHYMLLKWLNVKEFTRRHQRITCIKYKRNTFVIYGAQRLTIRLDNKMSLFFREIWCDWLKWWTLYIGREKWCQALCAHEAIECKGEIFTKGNGCEISLLWSNAKGGVSRPHTKIVYLGILRLVEVMARCNEPTASYIYEPVEFEK